MPFQLRTGRNVKFRIIEDMNDNGRWDTGNLVERRQPERAEYYMDDKKHRYLRGEGELGKWSLLSI